MSFFLLMRSRNNLYSVWFQISPATTHCWQQAIILARLQPALVPSVNLIRTNHPGSFESRISQFCNENAGFFRIIKWTENLKELSCFQYSDNVSLPKKMNMIQDQMFSGLHEVNFTAKLRTGLWKNLNELKEGSLSHKGQISSRTRQGSSCKPFSRPFSTWFLPSGYYK